MNELREALAKLRHTWGTLPMHADEMEEEDTERLMQSVEEVLEVEGDMDWPK